MSTNNDRNGVTPEQREEEEQATLAAIRGKAA
jgi:hypothetical protein